MVEVLFRQRGDGAGNVVTLIVRHLKVISIEWRNRYSAPRFMDRRHDLLRIPL